MRTVKHTVRIQTHEGREVSGVTLEDVFLPLFVALPLAPPSYDEQKPLICHVVSPHLEVISCEQGSRPLTALTDVFLHGK